MKKLSLIIIILLSFNLFGQGYGLNDFKIDSIPKDSDFTRNKVSKPPTFESIMRQIRKTNRESWVVKKANDSIKIFLNDFISFKGDKLPFDKKVIREKIKKSYLPRVVKKVENGYIVGYNGGEFSGGLYFLSTDGKISYEIESGTRAHNIFNFNNRLYVIAGLAHGGFSYGRLLEIKKERKWKVSKSFRLPGAPRFIVPEKESFLILTSEHLLTFDKEERMIQLLKAPFYWGIYYPSSAVVKNNHIYIAMRKGILKITDFKYNPNFEWYIKK